MTVYSSIYNSIYAGVSSSSTLNFVLLSKMKLKRNKKKLFKNRIIICPASVFQYILEFPCMSNNRQVVNVLAQKASFRTLLANIYELRILTSLRCLGWLGYSNQTNSGLAKFFKGFLLC